MKLGISALKISALALGVVCQPLANAYAQVAPIVQYSSWAVKEKAVVEAVVRQRVEDLAKTVSAKDIDRLMRFYAPDIISFDISRPLRYGGTDGKRRAWQEVFAAYKDLVYDVSELSVTGDNELAFVHSLNHVKGTLVGGQTTQVWVRWTACFRRINGTWLIVHDHVSVPADLEHGQALLNLTP